MVSPAVKNEIVGIDKHEPKAGGGGHLGESTKGALAKATQALSNKHPVFVIHTFKSCGRTSCTVRHPTAARCAENRKMAESECYMTLR